MDLEKKLSRTDELIEENDNEMLNTLDMVIMTNKKITGLRKLAEHRAIKDALWECRDMIETRIKRAKKS